MSDQILFDRPFVGYDGSPNCHDLITVYKRMHEKFENSTFVFVHDPRKNYITYIQRGPAIQKQIKHKTDKLENIDIKLIEKQFGEKKSVNQYILQQFFASKSSFIMLGFYGSKGQKVRSIDLSSRVRKFVYDSKTTVAIIKNPDRGTNATIFCCDGSQISYDGLKKAMIFCKKFSYTLTVLHVYNDETKTYSKQVKNELKIINQNPKSFKFDVIIQKSDLIKYLQGVVDKYDWIIVTKNGYRGQISKKVFIGQNTTQILTKVKSNLLIL